MVHTFYLGHDNEQRVELLVDGDNLPQEGYDALTRFTLRLVPYDEDESEVLLDSDTHPDFFAWGGADPGRVVALEGAELEAAGVKAGTYKAELVGYSGDQPDGIVWLGVRDYRVRVL